MWWKCIGKTFSYKPNCVLLCFLFKRSHSIEPTILFRSDDEIEKEKCYHLMIHSTECEPSKTIYKTLYSFASLLSLSLFLPLCLCQLCRRSDNHASGQKKKINHRINVAFALHMGHIRTRFQHYQRNCIQLLVLMSIFPNNTIAMPFAD